MLAVESSIRNSEELKKRAPAFIGGAIWGFLPLILLCIFGAIKITQALSSPSATPPLSPTTARAVATPHEEVTFEASLTPKYLADLYKGRTTVQGDALASRYVGKYEIQYSGSIRDVSSTIMKELDVHFVRQGSDPQVSAFFADPRWIEQLSALHAGDAITVMGTVYIVNDFEVVLKDSSIVSIGTSNAKSP